MKDHNPGKSFASPMTDENEIFMPFFHFNLITVCDIKLYFINSPGGDWYESLFASFSFYSDKAFIKIYVGYFNGYKLLYPKSAAV